MNAAAARKPEAAPFILVGLAAGAALGYAVAQSRSESGEGVAGYGIALGTVLGAALGVTMGFVLYKAASEERPPRDPEPPSDDSAAEYSPSGERFIMQRRQ